MGIVEILLFLVIALIVIPPDDLPQVMRTVGKLMRELRLASNTVMREISGAIGDDSPFNILPPRFDDPHPPSPSTTPTPPAPAFLAPEPRPEPPAEGAPTGDTAAAPADNALAARSADAPSGTTSEQAAEDRRPAEHRAAPAQAPAEAQTTSEQPSSGEPTPPSAPKGRVTPPDDQA